MLNVPFNLPVVDVFGQGRQTNRCPPLIYVIRVLQREHMGDVLVGAHHHKGALSPVDASRIETTTLGREQPAMQGSSEESWAKNRRDEFVIVAGDAQLRAP